MKHRLSKLITVILIATFAWQGLAWGHPGQSLRPRAAKDRVSPGAQITARDGILLTITDNQVLMEDLEKIGFSANEAVSALLIRHPGSKAYGFDRLQANLLKEDFRHFVYQKLGQQQKEIVFVEFGLGEEPKEARELLRLFYEVLVEMGENASSWKVRLYGFDDEAENLEAARSYFKSNVENENVVLNELGIGQADIEIQFQPANLYDFYDIQRKAKQLSIQNADYIIVRNVNYENQLAGDGRLSQDLSSAKEYQSFPEESIYRLHDVIAPYISYRNLLMIFGRPRQKGLSGTRYLIEPKAQWRPSPQVFVAPGTEFLGDEELGVLEFVDADKLSQAGLVDFQNLVLSTEQRMSLDDEYQRMKAAYKSAVRIARQYPSDFPLIEQYFRPAEQSYSEAKRNPSDPFMMGKARDQIRRTHSALLIVLSGNPVEEEYLVPKPGRGSSVQALEDSKMRLTDSSILRPLAVGEGKSRAAVGNSPGSEGRPVAKAEKISESQGSYLAVFDILMQKGPLTRKQVARRLSVKVSSLKSYFTWLGQSHFGLIEYRDGKYNVIGRARQLQLMISPILNDLKGAKPHGHRALAGGQRKKLEAAKAKIHSLLEKPDAGAAILPVSPPVVTAESAGWFEYFDIIIGDARINGEVEILRKLKEKAQVFVDENEGRAPRMADIAEDTSEFDKYKNPSNAAIHWARAFARDHLRLTGRAVTERSIAQAYDALFAYIGIAKSQGGRPRATSGPTREDRMLLKRITETAAGLNESLGRPPSISEVADFMEEYQIYSDRQKRGRVLAFFLKGFVRKELRQKNKDTDEAVNLAYDDLLVKIHIQKVDKGIKRKKTERLSDANIEMAIKVFTAKFSFRHNMQAPNMELVAKNVKPFKDNKNALQSLSIWITKRVNSLKIGRKGYVIELGIKIRSKAGAHNQIVSQRELRSVLEAI